MKPDSMYNPSSQDRIAGLLFFGSSNEGKIPSFLNPNPGAILADVQEGFRAEGFCFMSQKYPAPPTGTSFAEWVVVGATIAGNKSLGLSRRVPCMCSCGRRFIVAISDLYSGKSPRCRWCGNHTPAQRNIKIHGAASTGKTTPEYNSWVGMIVRCNAAAAGSVRYAKYVGVSVALAWTGEGGFQRFLAHVGYRPSLKHSIDRWPNPKGNYEPGNVRWATAAEKNRNKSNIKLYTFENETLCVKDWADQKGIPYTALCYRLNIGCSFEEALAWPVISRGGSHCFGGHEFTPENTAFRDGVRRCKTCARTTYRQKKARIKRATPAWLTRKQHSEIARIYDSCPDGYHVDHEIPLCGKTVSGLHVPWNLRAIPAFDNMSKGNKLIDDLIVRRIHIGEAGAITVT